MNIKLINKLFKFFFIFLIFIFNFSLANFSNNHGFSLSMTNNGHRISYSNNIFKKKDIEFFFNMGIHNETTLSKNYYNQISSSNTTGKNLVPINLSYKNFFLNNKIVGIGKPFLFFDIGTIYKLKKIKLNEIILTHPKLDYSLGTGLTHMKNKIKYYFFVGYNSSTQIDGSVILGLNIIWV